MKTTNVPTISGQSTVARKREKHGKGHAYAYGKKGKEAARQEKAEED